MSKIIEQWLLFEYVGLEFTPLSKPYKTREQAEKAREKYPERLRKSIGVGVIRIKKLPGRSLDGSQSESPRFSRRLPVRFQDHIQSRGVRQIRFYADGFLLSIVDEGRRFHC